VIVKLVHGIYPMTRRPTVETCLTVIGAKRLVRKRYENRSGWWFQIFRNGKEVWSSDHELARMHRGAASCAMMERSW
jgi:hypothetical protein